MLQRIIETWSGNPLAEKQISNVEIPILIPLHEELPSRTGVVEKRTYTSAINGRQAHLTALQTIIQNSHWYNADAESNIDIARHARTGKHARQIEKAVDTVLAEQEDAVPAIL